MDSIYAWTRCLKAKPSKCWSLGLTDRRFLPSDHKYHGLSYGSYDPQLTINGEKISFIERSFFKHLGRKVYAHLKDSSVMNTLSEDFSSWMKKLDAALITGTSKAWIYEHYVLTLLRWPFLVYDASVNMVSPMHKTATRYLKHWYGLHVTANPSILYLPTKDHGLGLTSIIVCYKTMQLCCAGTVKYSMDPTTRGAFRIVSDRDLRSTSNTWKPSQQLIEFEKALQHQDKYGGQSSRLGLGYKSALKFRSSNLKMKRRMVAAYCKREEAQKHKLELLRLSRNSDYIKWDELISTDRGWHSQVFGMSPELLAFTLNFQTNTLPSPSNLRRWGSDSSDYRCALCGKFATTAKHTLSNCSPALYQGRYKWRHDNNLRVLEPNLRGLINKFNGSETKGKTKPHISQSFVKAGSKARTSKRNHSRVSLLDSARDWVLLVDGVPNKTTFPPCTGVDTVKRPDIIIYSLMMKIIIWAELTVPLEENVGTAATRKTKRYCESTNKKPSLKELCERNHWTVHPFTIEVGTIGFIAASTRRFLHQLGFPNTQLRWIEWRLSQVTKRSSYLIWCSRHDKNWTPANLFGTQPAEGVPVTAPKASGPVQSPDQDANHRMALEFLSSLPVNIERNVISESSVLSSVTRLITDSMDTGGVVIAGPVTIS